MVTLIETKKHPLQGTFDEEDFCHHCRKWVKVESKAVNQVPSFPRCPRCKYPVWERMARQQRNTENFWCHPRKHKA